MKLYHGTTFHGRQGIEQSGKLKPSGIGMPETMSVILDAVQQMTTDVESLPRMGGINQPSALGIGIYAFDRYQLAFNFTAEHQVVELVLNSKAEVFNLDDAKQVRVLANALITPALLPLINQKVFGDEELITQYSVLCSAFSDFLIDVADGVRDCAEYPYIFGYSLWIIWTFLHHNIKLVAKTFGDQPRYYCIQDTDIIEKVTI